MILPPKDLERLVQHKLYTNTANLSAFLSYMYGANTAFRKNVLDVGGGDGLLCLSACLQGARSGDCLDPEGDGSTAGSTRSFSANSELLGLSNARMFSTTFQAYEAPLAHYDLVFINNAINHLDEPACMSLHESAEAQDTYRLIFDKLRSLLQPNGRVIVTDCSRSNAFGDLGIKAPFAPTIEWNKHQNPETWTAVVEPSGFRNVLTQWTSFNSLGRIGRLLGNRAISYMLMSHFRIEFVAV